MSMYSHPMLDTEASVSQTFGQVLKPLVSAALASYPSNTRNQTSSEKLVVLIIVSLAEYPGWHQVNGSETANVDGWFNSMWKHLLEEGVDQGCIGGAFFEYSDEPYSKGRT